MLKGIPCVSQALVVGDRRPYLVALITLDDGRGRASSRAPDDAEGARSQRGRREGQRRASRRFEQIRRFAILPRDFSPSEDEITPTLKLKRRVVEEHFAARDWSKLYASS